jgi:hypothetical protein
MSYLNKHIAFGICDKQKLKRFIVKGFSYETTKNNSALYYGIGT